MAIGTPLSLGTTANDTSSASIPLTTTAAASAAKIIVVVTWAAGLLSSVTDSAGNTYTIDSHIEAGTDRLAVAQADGSLASGGTITANFDTAGVARGIAAVAVTGLATGAGSLDTSGTDSVAGTSWTTPSVTPTSGDRIVLGAKLGDSSPASSTATSPWSETFDFTIPGEGRDVTAVYQTVTADGATAYQPAGTFNAAASFAAGITVVYKSGVPPQTIRPDSDLATGSWTPTPSSPTTLWDKVDEATTDDTDYMTSGVAA